MYHQSGQGITLQVLSVIWGSVVKKYRFQILTYISLVVLTFEYVFLLLCNERYRDTVHFRHCDIPPAEPGLWKAFKYFFWRKEEDKYWLHFARYFNFSAPETCSIVWAGNVVGKCRNFDGPFFFFFWPLKHKVGSDKSPGDLNFWRQSLKCGTFTFM